MQKVIPECPVCGGRLKIAALRCTGCGLELRNDFEQSVLTTLNPEQEPFLLCFLKHRGNMSLVQGEMGISYPTAKKRLDNLLEAMGLVDSGQKKAEAEKETVDMTTWSVPEDSVRASDIIKRKLMENGGRAVVRTARGLPCEIRAASDGMSFLSDKLPVNPPYRYEVFDVMTDLMASQGGRARKGDGRGHKLGEEACDETTLVGAIGYRYAHAKTGKSVYDPVFVLSAVLEWAGIASNGRGELILTEGYRELWRAAEERGNGNA